MAARRERRDDRLGNRGWHASLLADLSEGVYRAIAGREEQICPSAADGALGDIVDRGGSHPGNDCLQIRQTRFTWMTEAASLLATIAKCGRLPPVGGTMFKINRRAFAAGSAALAFAPCVAARRGQEDPALRAERQPDDPRSDLDDGLRHARPRLHDLRHAVRDRREQRRQAADGRQVRGLGRQARCGPSPCATGWNGTTASR